MMLSELEARLHQVVIRSNDESVNIVRGPSDGPLSDTKKMAQVFVPHLKTCLPENAENIAAARDPSYAFEEITWNSDGQIQDFNLPQKFSGNVTDVESPPGSPKALGDDYFVENENQIIRFYQPPDAGTPGVKALLRGNPTVGYQEKHSCQICIKLNVWAKTDDDADSIFAASLSGILTDAAQMGSFTWSQKNSSMVCFRLLNPLAVPETIERDIFIKDNVLFYKISGCILFLGNLQITVSIQDAEEKGYIEDIRYKSRVKGSPV